MKKTRLISALLIAALLTISSCGSTPSTGDTPSNDGQTDDTKNDGGGILSGIFGSDEPKAREVVYGGANTNTIKQNSGFACMDDKYIYYKGNKKSNEYLIFRVDHNGQNFTELYTDSDFDLVGNLLVHGGDLYFTRYELLDKVEICRLKPDKSVEVIKSVDGGNVAYMTIFNDDLFYALNIKRSNTSELGVINLKTGESNVISDQYGSRTIDTDGKYIYFHTCVEGYEAQTPIMRVKWDDVYKSEIEKDFAFFSTYHYWTNMIFADGGFYVERRTFEGRNTFEQYLFYSYEDMTTDGEKDSWQPKVLFDSETEFVNQLYCQAHIINGVKYTNLVQNKTFVKADMKTPLDQTVLDDYHEKNGTAIVAQLEHNGKIYLLYESESIRNALEFNRIDKCLSVKTFG